MKERIFTGVVLGLLALWGILGLNHIWFGLVSILVLMICAWEWAKFAGADNLPQRILYVLITAGLMLISMYYTTITLLISVVWWMVAWAIVWRCSKEIKPISVSVRYLMGFFVIVPTWISLSMLHDLSPMLLLFVLLVTTVGDSGAYFVGRSRGKRKLSPIISPKKTKEGLLGGVILGGLSGVILGLFLHVDSALGYLLLVFCGFAIVLFALLGDLFESMIKRIVGIKDSGNILPGHGGALDRLDSIFAAMPLFVVLCILLRIFPGLTF